jgi:Cu/Ag efflux protein CusF
MNTLITAVLLGLAAASATAQTQPEDHSAQHASTSVAAADMTQGEIRKVDKEAKKLTIRHGEIRNLDMPAMTMVFKVKDPAMLDQVKPGDKVRFIAEGAGSGLVVTELRLAQ